MRPSDRLLTLILWNSWGGDCHYSHNRGSHRLPLTTMLRLPLILGGCSSPGSEADAQKYFHGEFQNWIAGQKTEISTMDSRLGLHKPPISYNIRSVVRGQADYSAYQGDTFGWEHVFILSAGWGLIRADFLTPDYNITFSSQGDAWARRSKRLRSPRHDFNHLAEAKISPDETIHFFGGRDYLPLYLGLTQDLKANKIIHHRGSPPTYAGYVYEQNHGQKNQNWHYGAAKSLIRIKPTIQSA